MVYFHKNWRLRRSVLYMPSSNRRALLKAPELDCDCVVFDLEDAVAGEAKAEAYENLAELVRDRDFGEQERIIRVTAMDHPDFESDMRAAIACAPDAMLLPKVGGAKDIHAFQNYLKEAGAVSGTKIWAMIETPQAIINLKEIAATSETTMLECFAVGPNDLAKDTGAKMEPGREVMLPWLMQILAAARAYDLRVLDGVYNSFRDSDGFDAECVQGAAMGYDGKTLIHPVQIEAANARFGASAEDLDHARRVVSAFTDPANKGKAAIQIDGEMFERLHLNQAKQLIAYCGQR